jgi:hypothetical protein
MTRIGPSRLRLRRRLLIYSSPVTVAALLLAAKLISVVIVGNSAASSFRSGDGGAVRADAAILGAVNVIEPEKAPFAAGVAAVLENRLADADTQFTAALSRTDAAGSCPARVNLEIVRETQGDRAATAGDRAGADERYASALAVVTDAPQHCFAGNTDPDSQRHAIREDAANRLAAKRTALNAPSPEVPPPPPPPPPAAPPPPPPPATVVTSDGREIPPRQLDPAGGDPQEKLLQVLQDAEGAVPPGDSP